MLHNIKIHLIISGNFPETYKIINIIQNIQKFFEFFLIVLEGKHK